LPFIHETAHRGHESVQTPQPNRKNMNEPDARSASLMPMTGRHAAFGNPSGPSLPIFSAGVTLKAKMDFLSI